MYLNNLTPIAQGITYSLIENRVQQETKQLIRSNNYYFTALTHIVHVAVAFNQATNALDSLGRTVQLHWTATTALYITPLITAALAKYKFENRKIQIIFNFMHCHLGTAASIISLVSIGVLFWQGQVIFAGTSIAISGISLLLDANLLPESVSTALNYVGFGSAAFLVAQSDGWILKSIFVISSISKIASCILSSVDSAKETPDPYLFGPMPPTILTSDDLQNLDWSKCEINWEHLQKPIVLPGVPEDTDPNLLLEMFEKLATDQEALIKRWVDDDARAKEYPQMQGKDYIKFRLQELITEVTNNRLEFTDKKYNKKLVHLLNLIAHYLPSENSNNINKLVMLFRLVIPDILTKKLDLSPADKYEAVAKEAYTLILRAQDVPLEAKVSILLGMKRQMIFENYYKIQFEKVNERIGSMDKNLLTDALTDDQGLIELGAKADIETDNAAYKYFYKITLKSEWDQAFLRNYTIDSLFMNLRTFQAITKSWHAWWQKWVDRQQVDEATKKAWIGSLQQDDDIPSGIGNFVISGTQPNYQFIEKNAFFAMLVEMGVLLKPPRRV